MIVVSTDGSALGNPNGSMGWAWADHADASGNAHEHHHTGNADAGGATNGTNQIGELCAVLEALRSHPGSEPLTIESDSQYAINCATTWIHGWKKNGWKNSKNEPVKNAELIRAIDAEITKREGAVKFVWVKGHAGNAGNEKVDTLAHGYAEDCRDGLKDGYLPLEGWKSLLSSSYASGTDIPDDAHLLLDNKISSAEYHKNRTVGSDTNPDFLLTNKNTEDSDTADSDNTESDTTDSSPIDTTDKSPIENKDSSPIENKRDSETADSTDSETADSETADSTDSDTTESVTTAITQTQSQETQSSETQSSETQSPETKSTQTQSQEILKSVPGLSVSGVLQFTPPPNTSPTFNGEARYISGTINVSGYVQPDGTLRLDPTSFYIRTTSK